MGSKMWRFAIDFVTAFNVANMRLFQTIVYSVVQIYQNKHARQTQRKEMLGSKRQNLLSAYSN